MMQEIFEAARPGLIEALMGLIWLGLTYLAFVFRRYTGVFVEEKHLRTLHSAIQTGLLAAMDRGLTKDVITETVISYVRASVPDAVKALRPSDDVLATLIAAKAAERLPVK